MPRRSSRLVVPILPLVLGLPLGPLAHISTAAAQAESPEPAELVELGRAIDANPGSPEPYDAYAQAAFRLKRWDDAITRLKGGIARLPAYPLGWYKLGYAYRQKRAFPEAAEAYRRCAEQQPNKPDSYFGLGAALQGAGDRKGAIAAYRRYLELEKAPEKQKFIDQVKAELQKLEGAEPAAVATEKPASPAPKAAEKPAPALVPSPAPPTSSPASPQPIRDKIVIAPKAAPKSASSPPRADALALRAAADKLRQSNKLDEAAQAYERAVAADPGNLDLQVELGDVYFAQRHYDAAAKVFRVTVERDPGYALGWYNLAHAQARVGAHGEAVRAYREYIRLRPSDPDPYYGLGMAYKAMNDAKAAADAFRTYLKMEQRPELQRWIDRARRELDTLEGTRSGYLRDLKNPFEDRPGYASADDFLPPGDPAMRRNHERIQRELAQDDILPIELGDAPSRGTESSELVDPFGEAPPPDASSRERLARYAAALAAYRAALDRHAGEVATLYQRGAERVLANDMRGALKAWSAQPTDRAVEEAKARLEKARAALVR